MAMVSVEDCWPLDNDLLCSRLFLTEGIATVIFGFVIWFIFPDCKYLPCA